MRINLYYSPQHNNLLSHSTSDSSRPDWPGTRTFIFWSMKICVKFAYIFQHQSKSLPYVHEWWPLWWLLCPTLGHQFEPAKILKFQNVSDLCKRNAQVITATVRSVHAFASFQPAQQLQFDQETIKNDECAPQQPASLHTVLLLVW